MSEEKDYSEEGKKCVCDFKVKGKRVVVAADFDLLRKANAEMMVTTMKGTGKNAKPDIEVDLIAPGDKLLFFGSVKEVTDQEVFKNPILRMKACQKLTNWLTELMADDDDEEEEKKSQ